MLFTYKSITKNFQKCCLKETEELTEIFNCKSTNLKKKFLLGFTNQNRFLMGSAKTFGKMSLLDEFVPEDVKSIEMGAKTGLTANYILKINYKGKEDIFKIIAKIEKAYMLQQASGTLDSSPFNILKTIYEQVPEAKPSYLKDSKYLGSFAAKKDLLFIFTDKKLLILHFDETNISVKREIDYSKITDFDAYEKGGNYHNFYLEVESKPELYIADLKAIDGSYLNYISTILRQTNIQKTVPSYMDDDEQEIVSLKISETQFEAGLGKRRMRVASRNVYLLEKNKDGKLVPYKKIPISEIESIKADTLGTALKVGNNSKKHEIIIKTKDGKKTRIWNSDTERVVANKAIDYIRQNIS